jgi:hypothetical protein
MHPTISCYLATARAAELHSQAQRDALARAARHARTHKLEHAAPRLAAAGRRLFTSLRRIAHAWIAEFVGQQEIHQNRTR